MKKVLAIMLVFCMALTMVPITVSAESAVVSSGNCGQKGDQVTWTLTEDGTLTISGTGRMDDFNSYAMNERGELEYAISWSSYFDRIKALVVEEGVTYIGDHALYQALELTTVDFPESLTEIGDQVFSGCAKLTTINFGTGLTKTGIEVFSYCDGLTAVTLPLGDVQYGRNIFSNCSNLSSVTIPDTQTSISERMFCNCKKLTQIYIPNSVTKIGGKAFEDSGLTSIDIPNSVTSLGKGVFYNCDSLTEVEIPGSVSEIPTELFFSCDNLTGVIFNAGTTELGTGILAYCNKVSEITIPSTVTKLGRTFEHAFGLKTVTFRGDAPEIHSQAFQSVTATAYYPEGNATWTEDKLQDYSGTITWKAYDNTLASGTWGDNISWTLGFDGTLIVSGEGEVAENRNEPYPWKEYAEQIIRVIFEEGVTNVPVSAFEYYYPNLTSAELKSVEIIESTAFAQCTALTSIILPDTLTEIDNGAFSDAGLTTIDIHEGVTRIGMSAFSGTKLTDIVLPDGLLELGNGVFFWCENLKSAYLPDSITKVGMNLFTNCTALETANIPRNLTYVPESMFSGCSSLKSIEIPDGITAMYMNDFEGTALTTVTIPASVTLMGSAFMNCLDLKEIVFEGDAPEMYNSCFRNVVATAYYPAGNETWTEEVMKDYGGTITWVAYESEEKLPCDDGHHVPEENFGQETGVCVYCGIPCRTSGTTIWFIEEDGTMTVRGTGENDVGEMYAHDANWTKYADQVTTLVVEEGVTGLIHSFADFTNLKNVSLASTVTEIEKEAFRGCISLEQISFPENMTHLNSNAFRDCTSLTEVHLPASMQYVGSGIFAGCSSLTGIWVDENSPYFVSDAYGVLYKKDWTYLVQAPGKLAGDYKIAETVVDIGTAAFEGCTELIGVTIPEGVEWVFNHVFKDCTALKSITIPASVSEIWYYAFENCTALETITFVGDAPDLYEECFAGVTATAYYPAGNETWTEEVMQDYGGTITWVSYGEEVTNYVKWYSGTTSLNGTIDLNIYVLLSDDLVNADDTYVRFTYAGQTVDVPMADALYAPLDTAPNRYRFSCPIYAKQLTDAVNVKFMKGDAVIGSELNYSVVTYCKNRINNSTDPAEVALCKALLNYGTASQLLFNYNTDNLANASLSDADKVLKDVDASAYKYSVAGSESGIKAKSATLMLEDVVKVRVYFTLTGNKTIDEYTFTIDGEVVTPQYNDKGWYVETDGIAAKDLEKMFRVQVGGITVTYGALSYVNSKVNGSNTLESNISKALYAYWQAAEALLG